MTDYQQIERNKPQLELKFQDWELYIKFQICAASCHLCACTLSILKHSFQFSDLNSTYCQFQSVDELSTIGQFFSSLTLQWYYFILYGNLVKIQMELDNLIKQI